MIYNAFVICTQFIQTATEHKTTSWRSMFELIALLRDRDKGISLSITSDPGVQADNAMLEKQQALIEVIRGS